MKKRFADAWYGAGLDGGRRTAGWGGCGDSTAGDGRRAGGAGDTVPGEAADEAVRQEDKVRGAEAQRGEAAADEGPLRQATCRCRRGRRRRRSYHCRPVRRHLALADVVRARVAALCPCVPIEVRPRPCRCECRSRWTTTGLQVAARRPCQAVHGLGMKLRTQNSSKLL